jgi:hypothetical protein
MRLTDWRGNEYGVGDTVLYPRVSGRSAEISEGTVTDIYQVYYGDFKWRRWRGEGPEPTKFVFDGWDEDGKRKEKEVSALGTRVQIQPSGRTSRDFGYWSAREYNAETQKFDKKAPKAVTILNIENITKVGS